MDLILKPQSETSLIICPYINSIFPNLKKNKKWWIFVLWLTYKKT